MRVPIKRWGKLAFYVGLGAVAAVAAACQKDRTPEPVPEDAGHDTRQNDASGATVGSSQPIASATVSTTASASAPPAASSAPPPVKKPPKPKSGTGRDSDLHFYDYE